MTSAPCRILDWDSRFFGYTIARVEQNRFDEDSCSQVLDWCRRQGVQWLYFLADADDAETVQVAQAARFTFVDIRLELAADVRSSSDRLIELTEGFAIRAAAESDVPALEAIAADAHRESRFFFDSRVPRQRAQELYVTWIRNSVLKGFADHVLVADVDGIATGYVTGRRVSRSDGSIGLVGVGEAARGRGLGLALIRASLRRFALERITEVSVVTQARNVRAQRLYARCGFLSKSVRLWYHRWFT